MASAIITGSNRGTGAGIAEVLRAAGYRVVGWDRTAAPDSDTVRCDVRDPDQVGRAACDLPPDLTVVVANAGIRRFGAVDDLPLSDWRDSVDTNLSGVYYLARATLPLLRTNRGAFIVVGSHAEKYPFEGGAAYCATKLALRGLVDCLIADARHDGVRATYLSLGAIRNRDHGEDEGWKLTPRHVGEVILALLRLPDQILVPYLDARPLLPPREGPGGIGRLQNV
jgi:NAD(P)-dependent dehydrogenase (short-subunit alcohol dehydrogenase family)